MFEGWHMLLRPWCKFRGYHKVWRQASARWLDCRTCWSTFYRSTADGSELVRLMPEDVWVSAQELE